MPRYRLVKTAAATAKSGAAKDAPRSRSRGAARGKPPASSSAGASQEQDAVKDVFQRKMTWSMHVPTGGDYKEVGELTCDADDVPLEVMPDTAEYQLHQKDEALRADIEESAVAAETSDDLLLFSDTVNTQVRQKLKARVKACAQHIEVGVCPFLIVLRFGWRLHSFTPCTHCKCAGVHTHVEQMHSPGLVLRFWQDCFDKHRGKLPSTFGAQLKAEREAAARKAER